METTQKKGMSKGCMVALIVAGVLIVLVIILAALAYVYKDDLVKFGTTSTVNAIKKSLAENPADGVDTVRFNAVADQFMAKLGDAEIDPVEFQTFFQELQGAGSDQQFDSSEVESLIQGMVGMFPELNDLPQMSSGMMDMPMDSMPEDSTEYIDSM